MNLDKIGAILKSRIKECDYTQDRFAYDTGVGLSSIKKYISGQVCYTVDTLEIFSKALNCSYDYLLGKSKTPNPEYHTIKEQTQLADGTIERLLLAAQRRGYDDYVPIYDFIIQNDDLVDMIKDYLEYVNKVDIEGDEDTIAEYGEQARIGQTYIRVGEVHVKKPDIPDTYLMGIVRCIVEHQYELGEDNPKVIRGYHLRNGDGTIKMPE